MPPVVLEPTQHSLGLESFKQLPNMMSKENCRKHLIFPIYSLQHLTYLNLM